MIIINDNNRITIFLNLTSQENCFGSHFNSAPSAYADFRITYQRSRDKFNNQSSSILLLYFRLRNVPRDKIHQLNVYAREGRLYQHKSTETFYRHIDQTLDSLTYVRVLFPQVRKSDQTLLPFQRDSKGRQKRARCVLATEIKRCYFNQKITPCPRVHK